MELGRILNEETFLQILDWEVKRARRYQNYFSIITLRIADSVANKQAYKTSYLNLLDCMRHEARESDIVASMREKLVIALLPYADFDAASQTVSRLQDTLKIFDLGNGGPTIKIEQFCFPKDGVDTKDLISKLIYENPIRNNPAFSFIPIENLQSAELR